MNVGGHNRVSMADLRDVFVDLGFTGVASVIQSGNIVFESSPPDRASTAAIIEAVERRFDVHVPVTLRTAATFTAAVEAHPFDFGEVEAKFHHIMFLATPAPLDAAQRLDERVDGDDIAVIGSEVHVRYRNGSGRARFSVDWVDRQLGTVATARNLPTCRKVVDLLQVGPTG